jgi:endo-1,4-beta-xylanase
MWGARFIQSLGLALLLHAASEAAAAAVVPALPTPVTRAAPVNLLPADLSRSYVFTDHINPHQAPGSFKFVGRRDGELVFLADNPKGSANYGGINARWLTRADVKAGDVLYARFAARALKARQESGEAEGLFAFQRADGQPGDRNVQTFSVGPDWTLVHVPVQAHWDAKAGAASAQISFGHLEQTIEIAGLVFVSLGQRLALADLPVTRFSYHGREADAAWRKDALARIQKLRTAPLQVQVVDAAGKPVAGAQVQVTQLRSAFLWGSEVNADRVVATGPDADRYRQAIVELFDVVVPGNGLKWPRWREAGSRERTVRAIQWLLMQGKRVKGHNLAWTGWKFTPRDIANDPAQRERIGDLVEAHIREILAATQGQLIGWDVVNEPVNEADYYKYMPRERVAKWFKMAQAADPRLELTVNEYAMLNRSSSPLFIERFREYVAMLRREGARVDVLGVQGHIGQTPRPPSAVLSDLDLLAAGGNKIQITEFDFNTPDEALQAEYTRDFLIALYSHEAVTGFMMWGFWQGDQWKPLAAMYRKDWSEKPNLQVWKDLVLGEWKTRASGRSAADGDYGVAAHHGRYLVRAQWGGKSATTEIDLGKEGARVVLKIQ